MRDFKPPLTLEELHAIGERNRGNKDVVRLLWEIKRLHAIVGRADQLVRSLPRPVGAIELIVNALRNEIKDDPVVTAHREMARGLFNQKVEPGDDD